MSFCWVMESSVQLVNSLFQIPQNQFIDRFFGILFSPFQSKINFMLLNKEREKSSISVTKIFGLVHYRTQLSTTWKVTLCRSSKCLALSGLVTNCGQSWNPSEHRSDQEEPDLQLRHNYGRDADGHYFQSVQSEVFPH